MSRTSLALALTSLVLGACAKDAAPASEASPVPTPKAEAGKAAAEPEPAPSPAATAGSSIYDIPVSRLGGDASSLADHKDKVMLVVNVASECGLTPQYEGLEKLQKKYGDQGFTVVGFPCNQFGGQEPGNAEEIKTFCRTHYGVSFPMYEKIEVNGPGRHPIYSQLTKTADAAGKAGDVQWNFEKFLVTPGGASVTRFRPRTTPEDPKVIAAIEAALPTSK